MGRFLIAILCCGVAVAQAPEPPAMTDLRSEIRAALTYRVDRAKSNPGMVVGILIPEGTEYFAHGVTDAGGRKVDSKTLFEIGSVTKVFAALLLCDMVEKGEVKLDDPVSKYLPASVSVPSRSGKQITLLDLGTHYSGLPDYPSNLSTTPGSKYTVEQLYRFLSQYQLLRDPGSSFEYSNIGMGLLALALSGRAGTDFETLLEERIFRPLGMSDTGIALPPEQRERSAVGHDRSLHAVEWIDWKDQAMAGAGALHSNAEDMLRFAAAVLGTFEHPLKGAMRRMLSVTRAHDSPGLQQHLGWTRGGGVVLFHSGQTLGSSAALAIRPDAKRASIVLSNGTQDANDIVLHAMVAQVPIVTGPQPRIEVAVDPEVLKEYAGMYSVSPDISIQVTLNKKRLFVQATGSPQSELASSGRDTFFDLKKPSTKITFHRDKSGVVDVLELDLGGGAIVPAKRLR